MSNMSSYNQRGGVSNAVLFGIPIAFIVLVAIALAIYFLVFKKKETKTEEPKYCDQTPFGKVEQGKSATADCPTGFTGQQTGVCNADGTFTVNQKACLPIECKNPPSPFAGTASPNQKLTAACPSGFTGNQYLTCLADGSFSTSPDKTSCLPIECKNPPSPFTGTASLNQTLTAPCPSGFTGTQHLTCLADGSFSNSDKSSCLPITCKNPPALFTGTAVLGEQLTAQCPSGFTGTQKTTCLADGTFATPDQTSCVRTCFPEAPFPTDPINEGQQVTLSCGYGMAGTQYATCQPNGSMSATINTCTNATYKTVGTNEMVTSNFAQQMVGFTAPVIAENVGVWNGTVEYKGVAYPKLKAGTYNVSMELKSQYVDVGGNWIQIGSGYAIARAGAIFSTKRMKNSMSLLTAPAKYSVDLSYTTQVTVLDGDAILPLFELSFKNSTITKWQARGSVTKFSIDLVKV